MEDRDRRDAPKLWTVVKYWLRTEVVWVELNVKELANQIGQIPLSNMFTKANEVSCWITASYTGCIE